MVQNSVISCVHCNAIVAPAFSWSSALWAWLTAGVASAANQSGGAGDNSERGIQQRMFQCDCFSVRRTHPQPDRCSRPTIWRYLYLMILTVTDRSLWLKSEMGSAISWRIRR